MIKGNILYSIPLGNEFFEVSKMKKYLILLPIWLFSMAFAAKVKDFASIKLLMRAISYDLPTSDIQARKLEKAIVNNIDLIIKKHTVIFACQNGVRNITKTYIVPFGGAASSGKSFTFMHFFGQALQISGESLPLRGNYQLPESFAQLGKYHTFKSFLTESTTLHSILESKWDQNQIDILLQVINDKFIQKPAVKVVFLMEAATALLKFISMNPQFSDYLSKMGQETAKGQYSKKIAFQRSIIRIQLAQMKLLKNYMKSAKGGVFLVFKDRVEGGSFGYCSVDKIPVKAVNRYLPVSLSRDVGLSYDKVFFFGDFMLPPEQKKLAEVMNRKELLAYYRNLVNSIKGQYKVIIPKCPIEKVGPVKLSTPMQSQALRMRFIAERIAKVISQ